MGRPPAIRFSGRVTARIVHGARFVVEGTPNRPDSVVEHALDGILGARSRVATLRVLARERHYAWPSRIAIETGLPRSTVWNAIHQLEAEGVIEARPMRVHRQVQWRIRPGHPLRDPLRELFRIEREAWLITDPDAEEEREWKEYMDRMKAQLIARGIPIDESRWP